MPEQITKYPEVTVQVLQGAGARCGPGVEKKILTQCPSERFCSFKSGEICAFGIDQIPRMTQVTTQELARIVCPATGSTGQLHLAEAALLAAIFAVGVVVGAALNRWRRR